MNLLNALVSVKRQPFLCALLGTEPYSDVALISPRLSNEQRNKNDRRRDRREALARAAQDRKAANTRLREQRRQKRLEPLLAGPSVVLSRGPGLLNKGLETEIHQSSGSHTALAVNEQNVCEQQAVASRFEFTSDTGHAEKPERNVTMLSDSAVFTEETSFSSSHALRLLQAIDKGIKCLVTQIPSSLPMITRKYFAGKEAVGVRRFEP